MLFLAHKAVHAEFYPAPRHLGRYSDASFRYPETMAADVEGRPMWVENQRNSWHGVDFAYHDKLDVGRILQALYGDFPVGSTKGSAGSSTIWSSAANSTIR